MLAGLAGRLAAAHEYGWDAWMDGWMGRWVGRTGGCMCVCVFVVL